MLGMCRLLFYVKVWVLVISCPGSCLAIWKRWCHPSPLLSLLPGHIFASSLRFPPLHPSHSLSLSRIVTFFCLQSVLLVSKSGVLLVSGYSGCLAWKANDLKKDSRTQPELVGHLETLDNVVQLGKVVYSVPATSSLHVAACLLTRY